MAHPKLEVTLSRSDKTATFVLLAAYLDHLPYVRISDFIQVDIKMKNASFMSCIRITNRLLLMFQSEILLGISTSIFSYFRYNVQLHSKAKINMDNFIFNIFFTIKKAKSWVCCLYNLKVHLNFFHTVIVCISRNSSHVLTSCQMIAL